MRALSWDAIELEFLRLAHASLFLVAVSASGEVFKAASAAVLNTTAGRASWRRLSRATFYLSHAARAAKVELLMVADMQDMPTPAPNSSIPRLSSSAAPCVPTMPMPIPLKGFGSGDLELLLTRQPSVGSSLPPWQERRDHAAWRGTARIYPPFRTCLPRGQVWDEHPRGLLVQLSSEQPELVDAGFTSIGPSRSHWSRGELARLNPKAADARLASFKKPALPFATLASHRYAIEVDGSGFQASLAAKLLSGAAVLSARSHFPLWFAPALRDGEHFVSVAADLSDLAASRYLARARAVPLALHCVRSEPAAASVGRNALETELTDVES